MHICITSKSKREINTKCLHNIVVKYLLIHVWVTEPAHEWIWTNHLLNSHSNRKLSISISKLVHIDTDHTCVVVKLYEPLQSWKLNLSITTSNGTLPWIFVPWTWSLPQPKPPSAPSLWPAAQLPCHWWQLWTLTRPCLWYPLADPTPPPEAPRWSWC